MKAMILAAGRGTRMRPLTDDTPKPLLQIDELSLIEHLLLQLAQHDYKEIVINLAHLGDKIMAKLGCGKHYGVRIDYSQEAKSSGLETGGGILHALPLLGHEPFLVIGGDIWTDLDFSIFRSKSLEGLAHLILVDNPPYKSNGDFYLLGDQVTQGVGRHLTFGSIGVYHPELFAGCEPGVFPLAPLLYRAVANGKVTGEYFRGCWVNVGTPEILNDLRLQRKKASQVQFGSMC